MKSVKFYFDSVLSANEIKCHATEENCADCRSDGTCLGCRTNYTLVKGKCECKTIKDCIQCPNDNKICNKCKTGKYIN